MARFDIYRLKDGETLVVDLQATVLDNLQHRVVSPLILQETAFRPLSRLNPKIVFENKAYILAIHLMAAIPLQEMAESIGNISQFHDEIVKATDFLFQGF